MKAKSVFLVLLTTLLAAGNSLAKDLGKQNTDNYSVAAVEYYTLQKMISLESEKSGFYKILGIKTIEIEDTYYHKPALRTVIAYETPECKNNYYQGTAYSVHCSAEYCPVAIVYQKCY